MLNLAGRKWGTFTVASLFTLETGKGKGLNHLRQTTRKNGISYLGATNRNNGVLCFVEREYSMIQRGNCIAFIRNGEGSIGYSVYKAEDFIASSDLTIGYNERLNRHLGVFITTIADTVRGKYNFNYKRSDTRLAKELLQLPVNEQGVPDWAFMEEYIREREENLIEEYKQCILNRYVIMRGGVRLPLNQADWREFRVNDYFDVATGTESNMDALKAGNTPLVSAKKTGNGLKAFVSADRIKKGGVITWNKDGDGGAGLAYYQPSDFAADSHILVLSPKSPLSRQVCLFVTTSLSKYYGIFGHGRANSLQRASRTKIMLPATADGEPDWVYMEQYVREQEDRLLTEYKERILQIFNDDCSQSVHVERERAEKWKEFELSKVFPIIQRGKRLKTADHIEGSTPYVSSSAVNNGVDNFISNRNGVRAFADCITIANSGSVGQAFYHPYRFVASDHVTELKNEALTAEMYLFMLPIISRLSEKYNFNHEINDVRIRREKIMLPATDDGEPDWSYMEEYGRMVQARQVFLYMDYLEKRAM